MQTNIRSFFTLPLFPSFKENQNANTLNKFLWLALLGNLLYIISFIVSKTISINGIFLSTITLSGICASIWLLRRRHLSKATWVLLLAVWIVSIPLLIVGENAVNIVLGLYFILLSPALALLPRNHQTRFTLILISSLLIHFISKQLNLLPEPLILINNDEAHMGLIIMGIVGAILLFYAIQNLNKVSEEAEFSKKQLIESNKKLQRETKVRRQMADSFRESEKQFRLLFSEAPVGMAVINLDGTFTKVNPALCAMYKYSEEELMQKRPQDLNHPDWLEKAGKLITKAIKNEEVSITFEQHYLCGDGSSFIGLVHVIIERNEDGHPYRLLSQIVDITARREAELALLEERALLAKTVEEKTADLQKANLALREASTRKDEFLATMSHELRTPLNVILIRTQAMQMKIYGDVTDKQESALTGIADSSHHLLSLIKDILDVSKIASGEEHVDLTVQPINPILMEVVAFIMPIATENDLSLYTNIEDDTFYINGDNRRIKQILTNLLSNAVKFTPKGGQIGISLRGIKERKEVEICVEDTGIGISEADQARLFQPFTQIDSSLSRQFEGTGLGLSLVKQLVDLHGGSVKLESEENIGSKFYVYLPWVTETIPVENDMATQSSTNIMNTKVMI